MRENKERLQSLEQKYENVKKEIQNLEYVISGTIIKRQYRCGKQTCQCRKGPTKLHGPYYHWTRKIKGKTVNKILDKKRAEKLPEYIQNSRKLRKIIDSLHHISTETVKAIENPENI